MTAVLFPDPQPIVRDAIKAVLAGRQAGVTVSTKAALADGKRSLPWVQVRADGQFRDARLNGRATMRVLVWHKDEGLAQSLAGLIEALLLDYSGGGLRGFSAVTGPIPSGDPATGEALSFITITARLQPQNI
ncbi:tail terminator [Arthrobacter phage VroomVroom]|uniref:Tail terminator n=1 Tax=Arthrobacter phage VroomVroom TaxID=3049371 RepID=A0AA49FAD5_9CAUD|nr:tail terminator [Arthrobacter phage VroomVroom]